MQSIALSLFAIMLLGGLACAGEAGAPRALSSVLADLDVTLAVHARPDPLPPPVASLEVTLLPQVDNPGTCVVSFGLPFGMDWLEDDALVRVSDSEGNEIPTFTKPLAHWWTDRRQGGLRSVLVQFEASFAGRTPQTVTVTWAERRTQSRPAMTPLADTQVSLRVDPPADYDRAESFYYQCPKVLAVLPPEWLCASLLVWQQVPAPANAVAPWYDAYLVDQFDSSLRYISAGRRDFAAHLFDRPATYVKIYTRHGEAPHLLAALQAGDFYIQHLSPEGFFDIKPQQDLKYTFTEGPALLYLLTGDQRYRLAIDRAVAAWDSRTRIAYTGAGFWTERHHAFGLMAYLHAYEVSGDPRLLDMADRYFDASWTMQISPGDGREPNGAWLHTGASHGDGDPDDWITSPWMSAFLVDAIWKYWVLTGDERCPASLAMYAKFTQKHSVTPDGRGVFYIAMSPDRGSGNRPGYGSHNMEAIYMLAVGYYLSGGNDRSFLPAMDSLRDTMLSEDAPSPARKFTWRFRESSMLVWFLSKAEAATSASP